MERDQKNTRNICNSNEDGEILCIRNAIMLRDISYERWRHVLEDVYGRGPHFLNFFGNYIFYTVESRTKAAIHMFKTESLICFFEKQSSGLERGFQNYEKP